MVNADLKKWLPQSWTDNGGKNMSAIINAINDTHEVLENQIAACIDQLYLQTASGRYLIQLGEQSGFAMPLNSALDIRAYKILVPVMVSSPKQVRNTLDQLIQAFYQPDRTRSSIQSGAFGPYTLAVGDNLIIETDVGVFELAVAATDFANLYSVEAGELSALINGKSNDIRADEVVDRTTGRKSLRISSLTFGAISKIRIAGGTLQNVLRFPKLVDLNAIGTTWNISKPFTNSDHLTLTWDGIGTNPGSYLADFNDVLTIRGLVDTIDPLSSLNGTYTLIDVGHDYFLISCPAYPSISGSFTAASDTMIVTSFAPNILYDRTEYALTSETDVATLSMTVPAIPPLSRRFLAGSAHLHGNIVPVLDFTRDSVTLNNVSGLPIPAGDNIFVFKSQGFAPNFKEAYRSLANDNNQLTPIYVIDSGNPAYSVLPYTIATPLAADPFYGDIDSGEVILTFPFTHGLFYKAGFVIAGAVGAGSITTGMLNGAHAVSTKLSNTEVKFGITSKFSGISFSGCDIYKYSGVQPNGADFYLQFASSLDADQFTPGMSFKVQDLGTEVIGYLAQYLKNHKAVVVGVAGGRVDFTAGVTNSDSGLVISSGQGVRSGSFGGNAVTYYFDKTSSQNASFMTDLSIITMTYTKESNSAFVSSYLFDPQGKYDNVTLSSFQFTLAQQLLRGETMSYVQVQSADFSSFPTSGNLVLDYGSDTFEGPIRYYAITTSGNGAQLAIDPSYKFVNTHEAGELFYVTRSTSSYTPTVNGKDYPVYVTGTTQSRNSMFTMARQLVASGVFIEENVILPNLRYVDPAILPFS